MLVPEKKTLVDLYFVLVPNHEGGERVWSVENSPEGAVAALRMTGGGRVVLIPQIHQWATHRDANREADAVEPSLTAYEQARSDGKLTEFVAQNDL